MTVMSVTLITVILKLRGKIWLGLLFFFKYLVSVFTLILCCGLFNAQAIDGHTGRLSLGGKIVESACAIHPDSHEQIIIHNDLSIDRVIKQGGSEWYPFAIKLFNCSIERENEDVRPAFQITFNGPAERAGFSLQGTSSGLAIEIRDERGVKAQPGVALPPHPVSKGERTLNYNFRLIGNAQTLRSGSHFTSLNYLLSYY